MRCKGSIVVQASAAIAAARAGGSICDRGRRLDRARLIFCESAGPATEQLARFDLRQAELLTDTGDFLRQQLLELSVRHGETP
jgi:hypothetical protein